MTGSEWQKALQPMPRFITAIGAEEEAHEFQVSAICLSLAIGRAADKLDEILTRWF